MRKIFGRRRKPGRRKRGGLSSVLPFRRKLVLEALEPRRLLSADLYGVPTWQSMGPGPITNGQVAGLVAQNNPVSGAINVIAPHPTRPEVVYVGTVNGGIWLTTTAIWPSDQQDNDNDGLIDRGDPDEEPIWVSLTDLYPSTAISALAFSPIDPVTHASTDQTLFAGIGNFSSSGLGGLATGLLRTRDGGGTWEILGAHELFGLQVTSVVPTNVVRNGGQVVLLSALDPIFPDRGGVFQSVNGGVNWTRLAAALPTGPVTDLEADPGNLSRAYAAFPGQGVFRTDDAGDHWVQTAFAPPNLATSTRIELSISKAAPNPVYAGIIDAGVLTGVFRTQDRGTTWSMIGTPTSTDTVATDLDGDGDNGGPGETAPAVFGLHNGRQGGLHFSIAASPINPMVVYVGGDRQARIGTIWNDANGDTLMQPLEVTGFENSVGLTDWVGRLFRGDATPGLATWQQIVGTGAGGTAPHADSRYMVFDAQNNLLEADDGGINRLLNPGTSSTRVWVSINGNLSLGEVYSVGMDPMRRQIIAGLQDVGVAGQTATGRLAWSQVFKGDGAVVQIDSSGAAPIYYFSTQQLGGLASLVVDGVDNDGDGFTDFDDLWLDRNLNGNFADPGEPPEWNYLGLVVAGTGGNNIFGVEEAAFVGLNNSGIQFIQPWELNDADPTRLLIGTAFLYESLDRGANIQSLGGLLSLNGNAGPPGMPGGPPIPIDDDGDGVANEGDEFAPQGDIGWVTAMAYGGWSGINPVADVAYVAVWGPTAGGLAPRLLLRTERTAAGGEKDFKETAYRGAVIRDIVLDPHDWRTAYVIDFTTVYRTRDAGANWTELTGLIEASRGLERDLRTIEIAEVPATGTTPARQILLIGGQTGVYRAILPTNPAETRLIWTEFGTGLPNAPVMDLHYYAATATTPDALLAGTRGRGAWTVSNVSANLVSNPVLRIDGDGSANQVTLRRNPANPLIIEAFVNDALVKEVELSSLRRIEINGEGGTDSLTIDITNGLISIPEGIHYDGGSDIDGLIFIGPTGVIEATRGPAGPDQSGETHITRDGDVQSVFFTRLDGPPLFPPLSPVERLFAVGTGLAQTARTVRPTAFGPSLPAVGPTIFRALRGVALSEVRPISDPHRLPEAVGDVDEARVDGGSELLLRLLESATGSFDLSQIAFGIETPNELRDRLDAMDEVPGNVTFTDDGEVLRYDLRVSKTLTGDADLDVDALGGLVRLDGALKIAVDVDLHLVFGVDSHGFFIDAVGSADPELRFDNFRIDGDVVGEGRFGFLGVVVSAATMMVDPDVGLSIDLVEPGPDPISGVADGLVRLWELGTSFSEAAQYTLQGDPGADDLVLEGSVSVAAMLPGDVPPFELAADVRFTWAEITDPTTVTVAATTAGGQELFNFLNLTPEQVADGLRQIHDWLDGLDGSSILDQEIPFAGPTTLGDTVDTGDAFFQGVINVLESSGDPSETTLQDILSHLPPGTTVAYDPAMNALTYHVSIAHAFDPVSISVDLETGVDGMAGVMTTSTATVHPSVVFDFTFGLALTNLLNNESLLDSFFIRDAVLRGIVAVEAPDIDAAARLGPLQVSVEDGSGQATMEIVLPLEDPGTGAADGIITLVELEASLADFTSVVGTPQVTLDGRLELPVTAAPFLLGEVEIALEGLVILNEDDVDFSLTAEAVGTLAPGIEIIASTITFDDDTGLMLDATALAFGADVHLTGELDPDGAFELIATAEDVPVGPLTVDLSGMLTRSVAGEIDYYLQGFVEGELAPGLAILPGSVVRLGRDEGLEIDATASAFGATVHVTGDFEAGGDFSFAASTDSIEIVGAMVTFMGNLSRQAGELDWGLTASVTNWKPAPFLNINMLDVTLDADGIGFETTTTIAGVNGVHLVGDYRFDDSTYALMADVPLDWTPVSQVNLSDVHFFVTNRNTDDTPGAVRIGATADLQLFGTEFLVAARVTGVGQQWLAATPASGEWNPVPIPGFSIGQPFLVASTYDFVLEVPSLIEVTNPPTPLDIDLRQIFAGINLLGSGVLPESIPGVGGSAIQIAGLLPADLDLAKLSIDAKLVFPNAPEIAGLLALDAVGLRITGAPSIAVFGQGRVLHDQIPSLDQDIAVEVALVIDIAGTTVSGSLSLLSPIPNLFGVEGLNVIEGDGEFGINFATTPLPLPTIGFNFLVELPEFSQNTLGLPSQIGASLNVSTTQPILAMNVVDWRPFEPLGIDDLVIDQGSVVVAPNGGTIGTKVFPRGFSAAFDAEILGTDVSFIGVFDQATRGIVVKGSVSGSAIAGIGISPNGCDGLYEDGVDNSTPDWIDPDADNGARITATVIATAPQDNGFTVDFAVDLPGTGGLVCVHGEQTNSLLVLDGTITNWTPLPTVSLAGSLHAEVGLESQGMELGFDVHGQILGAMTHFVGAISASDAGFELFATGTIAWRFPGGGKFVDLAATIDLNKDSSFRIEVAADLRLPGLRPADVLLSGEISSSGVDVSAIVDDWQIVPGVSFEGTVDVAANIAGSQLAVNIDVDADLIGSTLNLEGQLLAGSSGFDLDLDGHVRFGGTRVGLVVLDLDASLDTRTSGFVIQFDGTVQVFSGGIEVDVEADLQSSSSGWRIEVGADLEVFNFDEGISGVGTVELDLNLGGSLQFGSSVSDFEFELYVDGKASIEIDALDLSSAINIHEDLTFDGDQIVIRNARPKIKYEFGIPVGITWKDLKLTGADPSPPRVTVTAERVLSLQMPVFAPAPLQIRGGNRAEQVEIFRRLSPPNSPQPGSGNVVVRATNDVGEWVTLLDLPSSLISLIDVDMKGGDDSIMIHPSIVIPTLIKGGNGSDTIQGGTGMDTIYGGSGSTEGGGGPRRFLDIATTLLEDRGDTINGGAGNDTIYGEAGNDVIVGGGGNDTIDGGTGVNIINGALQVTGTDRHDRLEVATNVRVIKSFPGSLSLSPELSFQTDVIVRSGFGAGPLVTLFRVPLDQISAIHIDAGSGNDTITVSPTIALPTVLRGGPGNDAIHAGAGPSTIFGGDGDDWIYGGPANDTIDCGPGIDTVVLSGGADVIDPASCEHLVAGPQVGTTDPGENHPPILAAIGDKTVDEGSPLTFTALATDQGDEARFVGRNGYQSAQDSPFNGLDFSYLHLENFEDGALNTPGVAASAGEVYPAPPADLVSQWRANGTAADSAGGNDGILRGNTRFADGHLGKAFSFDGAGDYVEVPNSLSLRFREDLTLEGWIFLSDSQRPAFVQSIASKGTKLSGSAWELSVVSDLFGNRPRLRSHARLADGSTISINGDTTLRFNEWYHVAMTYNGVRLACYVNGELDGSITERSSQLLALSTSPLLIGEDLSGRIDELSIYDRALSGAEIQAIVNAGGDDDSTDSVDSDDGEVDGRGTAGRSFVIDSGDPVAFTFNANTLQGFPTHVGVVWTDSMLGTQLTLEAFDANGASLGTTVAKLRDPSLFGRTAEDRFLGVTDTAGISKIELRSSGDGPIEIDHLQYGRLQGQPVRYSLDPGAPDGATINQLTGAFRWTPSEEQGPNVYSVTVRASDGGSPALSDSETFIITVNEVNDPPQMAPIPDLFVVRGQPVQFTVIASDFDLTTTAGLRFHLAGGAPAGATIDPVTGEFGWTPSVTQPLGESFVTVLVTDQGDSPLTSGVSISITVQADINPPTVTDVRLIADSRAITSIVIDVSEPLEPASARDPSHYHLVGLGPDGLLGTGDDHEVPLSAAIYVAGARAITLTPQAPLPFNEIFKLVVQPEAGAGSPLADVFGNVLDGDESGLPGGNHEIKVARGKSLSFLDHDGDVVSLTLWGSGVMELLQSGAGGALNLRVLALNAGDAYLSGEVTAAAANSDGLALLNVSGLSGVENVLSDPPFDLTVNARGVPAIFTLPGDFNRDGTVDAAGYVVWRKTLGAPQFAFMGADGNGDGLVDPADDAVWRANFGESIASPPPLPGDFNRDAAVDASDYVTWRKAMGTSTSAFAGADGNGNGLVDDADYAVWRANFGNTLAASASSAAHSVEPSEASPSSGSVQVVATGQATPHAGSWRNAKASGIGQPTTVSPDPPSPPAILATSFDFARKIVRQPFRPATAFEAQDRGLESDLAFTLHETDRYLTRSQELLLEAVSDADREWPFESEPNGLVPLNSVDKRLSIRDELFSKWNEWHHLRI